MSSAIPRTMVHQLHAQAERLKDRPALWTRRSGTWQPTSWRQYAQRVKDFALGLLSLGFGAKQAMVVMGFNREEWVVADLAGMACGGVAVGLYTTSSPEQVAYVAGHCEAPIALVENAEYLDRLLSVRAQLPALKHVIVMEPPAKPAPGTLTYAEVLERGAKADDAEYYARLEKLEPQGLAQLIYTSGTTGNPKGVMLTHRNLMSQQRALELLWKPRPGMRLLCYLPWHHSFGGLFERFFALHSGGCLAIDDSWGRDTKRLIANFKAIRPNVYFSVPKVYQELVAAVLADKDVEATVFNPELDFVFTAAAPLPLSASEVFRAHGVPVVEGWGLTETSPCCTLTERALERTPGVVGRPIPGVEVALVDDGEIVVRGPNVMQGYLDQPEATREVLDGDGWFHTGDLGEWTPGGLKILSRKDRMFKLSNGEKVFPAQLEETLRASCRYVKHSFVFGSGQPHPLALLFPSREMFQVKKDGAPADGTCECPSGDDSLAACLATCIHRFNQKATARFERIERAVVVCAEPSLESGELTPSFKLIPRAVEAKYRQHMRALEQHADDELPDDAIPVHPGQERKP